MKQNLLRTIALLIAAVAVFAAYLSWKGAETKRVTGLPRLGEVPDFTFTDKNGHSFGSDQLRGKIWVANFICLHCGGVYPILSSRFAELDRNFAKSDGLTLVTFILDSEYAADDTVAQYARRYEASEKWQFLTGAGKRVEDFAVAGLRIASGVGGNSAASFGTAVFVLVDGQGAIRSYYDGNLPEVVPRVLTDLGSLLRTSKN